MHTIRRSQASAETALADSRCRQGGRCGHFASRVGFSIVPLLMAGLLVGSSGRVLASPLDDVSPSSDGLPGADLFQNILGWAFWLALGVCGLVILYGAATWRGMNGNSGRGVEGKMYVAAGAIGAMVIGLAPTIVSVLFDAGQAG
jgi:hypothetical protein